MAARIRSLQNGINPIDELSRNDLVAGDIVTVSSLDAAATYAWTLVFVPEGSVATFSGVATAVSPGSFTVDVEGSYLVRLIVDAGLGTESIQHVRLRYLTVFGSLQLVAAGERRDGSGIIPVDVDAEGWANEQNSNLQVLKGFVAKISPSLATLYVDPTPGYGDHSTIQAAIDAAVLAGATTATPYLVFIQNGLYTEDLTLAAGVNLISAGNRIPDSGVGVLVSGVHTAPLAAPTDTCQVDGIVLANSTVGANVTTLTVSGGSVSLVNSSILQLASPPDVAQGPALLVDGTGVPASVNLSKCSVLFPDPASPTLPALVTLGSDSQITGLDSDIGGPSIAHLGLDRLGSSSRADFTRCSFFTGDDPLSTGILTAISDITLSRCTFSGVGTFGFRMGATIFGGAIGYDQIADLTYCDLGPDFTKSLEYDTTGVGGTSQMFVGSCRLGNRLDTTSAFPAGFPGSFGLRVEASTHRYDGSVFSGGPSVQDQLEFFGFAHNQMFPAGGPFPTGPTPVLGLTDHLILVDPSVGAPGPVIVTLPPAGSLKPGTHYVVVDFSPLGDGGPPGNGVDILPDPGDIVNAGAPGAPLVGAIPAASPAGTFASVKIVTDGISRWVTF